MSVPSPISRPKLTLPAEEAAALRSAYQQAGVILEYGSGGSTVVGAEMPQKTMFSVESDVSWLENMRAYFDENPPKAKIYLHHGNIGLTKSWGHPLDDDDFRLWPQYPTSIWQHPKFCHPDVVLIDGRFRVACFLTVLFSATKPLRLLFDDYLDRENYHAVESFVRPTTYHGRMAQFDLSPMAIPAQRLGWIIQRFLQPA